MSQFIMGALVFMIGAVIGAGLFLAGYTNGKQLIDEEKEDKE